MNLVLRQARIELSSRSHRDVTKIVASEVFYSSGDMSRRFGLDFAALGQVCIYAASPTLKASSFFVCCHSSLINRLALALSLAKRKEILVILTSFYLSFLFLLL